MEDSEAGSIEYFIAIERNICDDLQEVTNTFTTVMMNFMEEMREWKKFSNEMNKSPEYDKVKENKTKPSVD